MAESSELVLLYTVKYENWIPLCDGEVLALLLVIRTQLLLRVSVETVANSLTDLLLIVLFNLLKRSAEYHCCSVGVYQLCAHSS